MNAHQHCARLTLRPFPFGSSLSSGFGWFRITTPQRIFSYLVHSRFPGCFGRPVRLLQLFFPLSTRVYQTHAEGRGCLPFTGEAGVVPPNGGLLRYRFRSIIDLHRYAVTKVKRPSPPSPCLSRQFRANRSHTPRSKNVQRSCGKNEGLPSCLGAPDKRDSERALGSFPTSSFFRLSSIVHARPLAGAPNGWIRSQFWYNPAKVGLLVRLPQFPLGKYR